MDKIFEVAKRFAELYTGASVPEYVYQAYRLILNRDVDGPGFVDNMTLLYRGYDRMKYIVDVQNTDEFKYSGHSIDDISHLLETQNYYPIQTIDGDRNTLEQYQDIWVKGQLKLKGIRECEYRYSLIKEFCQQYHRPFTVLDIGANLGYFSIRLAEDFDCTVVAIEGTYGNWLKEILEENDNSRIILLNRTLSLKDIIDLGEVEHFDVILALSVIHHFPNDFQDIYNALNNLGDHLILEYPYENNACGQKIVSEIVQAQLPEKANILGYGQSHLEDGKRLIFELAGKKKQITKAYLGCPLKELSLEITSDYAQKTVQFFNKPDFYDWNRGINLNTYLWMNGIYPTKKQIAEMVRQVKLPAENHRDIQPWNIILQGDQIVLIDANDPNQRINYPDTDYLNRVIRLLEAEYAPLDNQTKGLSELSEDIINQQKNLLVEKDNIIQDAQSVIQQQASLIQEKDVAYQQQAALVQEKDVAYQQQAALVQEKDVAYQMSQAIAEQQRVLILEEEKVFQAAQLLIEQQKSYINDRNNLYSQVCSQNEQTTKTLNIQLETLKTENNALILTRNQVWYDLNSIYHSKSWQVTAPLRTLFLPIRWIRKNNRQPIYAFTPKVKGKFRQFVLGFKELPLIRTMVFAYKKRYPNHWQKMKSWFYEHIFPQNIRVQTENNSKDHVFTQNILVQTVNNRNEVVLSLDSDEKHYLDLIEKEISRRKNKQGETR